VSPKKKRPVAAEDLYRFQLITDCRISPDGQHVVFSVQRVNRKTEKKHSNLWVAPTGGGRPRQFTCGDQTDSAPRWSPDGRQIAFLSNRGNEKQTQIYLIPFDGGEARPLTDWQGACAAFEWSPDGKRLVCQFRRQDREAIEREEDERKKELGIVARHITRLFYKLDGSGYLPQERWHIWTVDARHGRAKQLTGDEVYDEYSPAWSPDGRQIAFCSNRSPDPDRDPDAIDIFVMPAAGGEARRIETPFGPKDLPAFSPDGQWIAYVGREGRGEGWRNAGLWLAPAAGRGQARNLTAQYDLHVASGTINDLGGAPAMLPPTWSRDGQRLYFQTVLHGDNLLQSISLAGDDLQTVVGRGGVVGPYTFDRQQTRLAYFFGQMADPGQVWLRDLAGGESRQLTDVNGDLLRGLELGEVEEVWFKGAAGNDLQGWILKPPGFDPAGKYPSILEIHGGPLLQYGNFFMHEFYCLAAQGYVVCFSNPRGGRGYGEAHAKAIWGAHGTADYADLMAWADYVAQKPYIDAGRMGVTGGSYGGYMTNWIIGHTDRFRAAVTQRSISNRISGWGTKDFNWTFQQMFDDQPPWEAVERYWDVSPLKHIGHARTPTLVIHSQQDQRCPLEQGEQMFVALKVLGVEAEFVLFPDEPHGLSRVGRTDRRIARLNHILRWFDRYLK
jgi:dipeptidyl aminopeptidase/acylaminoacyl peptidase